MRKILQLVAIALVAFECTQPAEKAIDDSIFTPMIGDYYQGLLELYL
ncbi:MAG TPA: hypothetical protein VGA21_06260 [Cyclobacteriaceae bacterium]|jgi:hypothetical protein